MTPSFPPLTAQEADWVADQWDRTDNLDPLPEARLVHLLRVVSLLDGSLALPLASQAELDAAFRSLVVEPTV